MAYVFTLKTNDIVISAQPEYIDHQSVPSESLYVWAYHIKIHNKGKHPVQLLNRYWHIVDGNGLVQEVRGEGVIGQQPVIMSGEDYSYSSSVSLNTPSGMMHGSYELKDNENRMFHAQIPVFSLDSYEQLRMPN